MKHVNKIKVIICDDHQIFRIGLKEILKKQNFIELVAEASSGDELVMMAYKHNPDLIITDIFMKEKSGVEATQEILYFKKGVRIIALSISSEESEIINMLEAGATGFVNKANDFSEIIECIKSVQSGKPYFSKDIAEKLTSIVANQRHIRRMPDLKLSDRETNIIRLICFECTSKEIAFKLKISKRTVEGHRTRIMDKLGARSIAGIITYAVGAGIITPDILNSKK